MGIFIGALVWLGGAGLSGRRESIADKYYWLRHFHSRCSAARNSALSGAKFCTARNGEISAFCTVQN